MKLATLPAKMASHAVSAIMEALEYQVRFVGGCVRDALSEREVHDVDMATVFTPDDVIKRLQAAKIKVIPTGIEHGTVTAVAHGQPIEITTLRKDMACDGRHATVEFTDQWEEDAARRDFTMNALLCDHAGNITDFFGGIDDLNTGCVKFVGNANERCEEDYLRILRFFRFYARYGKAPIDKEAIAACAAAAEGIKGLSGERIQKELLKLLAAPGSQETLTLMQHAGVSQYVFFMDADIAALEELMKHEKTIHATPNALLRLAVLLGAGVKQKEVEAIIARWKLSNKDAALLQTLCCEPIIWPSHGDEWAYKRLIRHYGAELCERLALYKAVRDGAEIKSCVALAREWSVPIFPLTGKDLIAKGVQPGKVLGELLKKAENHWEAQHYAPSKEALLDFLGV